MKLWIRTAKCAFDKHVSDRIFSWGNIFSKICWQINNITGVASLRSYHMEIMSGYLTFAW